jgi:ankyrin repeat protein
MEASSNGQLEVVKLLIQNGANINDEVRRKEERQGKKKANRGS